MGLPITPQMFGALADGSRDDTAAVNNAIAQGVQSGRNVYIPTGTYKLTSPINVFLQNLKDPVTGASSVGGITIYGDGGGSTLSFVTSPSPYNGSLFVVSDTTLNAGKGYFGFRLKDLHIAGATADTDSGGNPIAALQLGDNSLYTQLNACNFTGLSIQNGAGPGVTTGPALLLNCVLQSTIEGVFDSSSYGGTAGLRMRNGYFNRISASPGAGPSGIAIHITSSNANISNVFLSPDCENTGTGVTIDSSGAQGNVFVAPYFTGSSLGNTMLYGINVTAGGDQSPQRFIQPYYGVVTTHVQNQHNAVIEST
jgi:hypothetical protein